MMSDSICVGATHQFQGCLRLWPTTRSLGLWLRPGPGFNLIYTCDRLWCCHANRLWEIKVRKLSWSLREWDIKKMLLTHLTRHTVCWFAARRCTVIWLLLHFFTGWLLWAQGDLWPSSSHWRGCRVLIGWGLTDVQTGQSLCELLQTAHRLIGQMKWGAFSVKICPSLSGVSSQFMGVLP